MKDVWDLLGEEAIRHLNVSVITGFFDSVRSLSYKLTLEIFKFTSISPGTEIYVSIEKVFNTNLRYSLVDWSG